MSAKILVVEDDRDAATLLRMTLESADYGVSVLHDGAAALTWLAEHSIDLVISDWLMPYVDGWELQQRLAADPRHKDVPLLLVSTLDSKLPKFEHPHRTFMVKPFAPSALLSTVAEMLKTAAAQRTGSDQPSAPSTAAQPAGRRGT